MEAKKSEITFTNLLDVSPCGKHRGEDAVEDPRWGLLRSNPSLGAVEIPIGKEIFLKLE